MNANGGKVALVSAGNVSEVGGTVTASGLIVDAAGDVAFGIQETGNTAAFGNSNAVGTVAGSAGGVFGFLNGGALTIGVVPSVLDVASQSGISASANPAGDVLIQTNGAGQPLTLAGNILGGGRAVLDSAGAFSQIGAMNVSDPVLAIDTAGSGVGSLLSFIPSTNVNASAIVNLPPAGRTNNAIVFAGLQAPNSTVLLFADRGVVNGAMNVGQLGLSGTGASADLNGSIGGVTGPNAALSGSRSPGPDAAYLFNGCIIAAASCSPPPPSPPPTTTVQPTPTLNLPPLEFLVVAPQGPDELSILTVVPNLTATLNLVTPQPVTAREQQDPDKPVINIFDEERLCTETHRPSADRERTVRATSLRWLAIGAVLVSAFWGCETPPSNTYVSGSQRAAVTKRAVGNNEVDEPCHFRRLATGDFGIGARRAVALYCGNWQQPSGRIFELGDAAGGSSIRWPPRAVGATISTRALSAARRPHTRILDGAPALSDAMHQAHRAAGRIWH